MKKIFTLFLLLQTYFVFAQTNEGITFFTGSFNEALAAAKNQNQLLFIDCYTTWCGPCKWMASHVFTNDTIANFFNRHFISYQMDMEKGEGIEVAKKYEIKNYPTFLWLDGAGKQFHRSVGSKQPAGFLNIAMKSINPFGNLAYLEEQHKSGNKEPEILLAYAYELKDAYDMKYQTVADEYFRTQNPDDLSGAPNWKTILEFTPNLNSYIYNFIVEKPQPFYDSYGKDSVQHVLDYLALQSLYYATQQKDSVLLEKAIVRLKASSNKKTRKDAAQGELNYYKRNKNFVKYTALAPGYVDKYFWNDAAALNDVCWTYFMRVDDKLQLAAAEKWIAQSVKLDDKYYNTDTYANILNKVGKKKEAIDMANQCIQLAKKSGEDFSSTQELLDSMIQEK